MGHRWDRSARRIERLRARLEWRVDGAAPVRPKGMHEKAYQRRTQVSASQRSSSIRKSGRTPTLRAAHEDVTHPPARCVRELHTTHFADARRGWRHVGNARLNRCAEIAGTDMGIKRLCESGGRDDGARTTAIASLLMTFFLRDPFSTAQHRRST